MNIHLSLCGFSSDLLIFVLIVFLKYVSPLGDTDKFLHILTLGDKEPELDPFSGNNIQLFFKTIKNILVL